ncbi:MAG: Fic family protein [Dechloromonas sp.]|nr:MAG: Fic family protein [Dechloromonas sp.]
MYIHERKNWPNLTWDNAAITLLLSEVRHAQGRLLGQMESLGFQLREEATLATLTQDVVKTSEIEGEKLDAQQVRSSIARRMGIDIAALPHADRSVEGIVEVMLDATRHYQRPLDADRLFNWHAALFPTGRSGMQRITVGNWRTEASGPMQVVSGAYGRERVHYEAPSHDKLNAEMTRFLAWLNAPPSIDPVIASALAHFWFVTIHPFDDGNGRIARAIADMMLARSENSPERFYSMSAQIQRERNAYYDVLEACQRGDVDVTAWIKWYLLCLGRAIGSANDILGLVLKKATFWKHHEGETFNDRQRIIINRLFDGFEGKLTSSKWAKLTKSSQDTALRDISDLVKRRVLVKDEAGGRSTSYHLCETP